MTTVVTGPPGSGKTAYVTSMRRPGDLVWDFDAIAQTLAQSPTHPRLPHVTSCVFALRHAFLRWIAAASPHTIAYVIVTDPTEACRLAEAIHGARLVLLGDGNGTR